MIKKISSQKKLQKEFFIYILYLIKLIVPHIILSNKSIPDTIAVEVISSGLKLIKKNHKHIINRIITAVNSPAVLTFEFIFLTSYIPIPKNIPPIKDTNNTTM